MYDFIALRKGLSIPSETMFEYPCPFACYCFKEYSRNYYCLNKSNLQMTNIEYLRQLHHKMLNLKRTQFHNSKEFLKYSYEKDLVFGFA